MIELISIWLGLLNPTAAEPRSEEELQAIRDNYMDLIAPHIDKPEDLSRASKLDIGE